MDYIERAINKIAENKKSHFWLFSVILLLLTSMMMYLYSPLYSGHDFHFHLLRLQSLMNALSEGSFFPRYVDYTAAGGYGYLTSVFYPDVILIPFALIGNLTTALFAYQALIFTITILCGLFTYKTVNTIYKNPLAAAISALLYTFCIYRLLDLYNRAALGEVISFTFVPLIFLGLYYIIRGNYKKWYVLSIGFSLMIFTHLISSVLMFITLIIFLVIYNKSLREEPKRFGYLVLSGIVTLLLTAYYIYPMLEQMMSNTFYYETGNTSEQLKKSASEPHWVIWGMFTGIVHPKQIFVPGIGVLLTIPIILRLFVYEKSQQLKSTDILLIVGLVYVFAVSSLFPWGYFPFKHLNFIQLPWRLYEFASFFLAVSGGYYVASLLKTRKRLLVGMCVFISLIVINLFSDSTLYKETRNGSPVDDTPAFENRYHLGGLEYFPDKLPSLDHDPKLSFIHMRGDTVISTDNANIDIYNFQRNKGITSFDLKADAPTVLELPLIYYKGYIASLDNENISVSESSKGLLQVRTNTSGNVRIYYGGTSVQKVSWVISIMSILGLCVYILFERKRNNVIV